MNFTREKLLPNVIFKTSRSGGKGGQNVNKVNTKAELNFDFRNVSWLSQEEKLRIRDKLSNKLNSEGQVQVVSEEGRSQLFNKERAIEKLIQLLEHALFVKKPRKPTKPKKTAVENRLQDKHKKALKKISRRKLFDD